MALDSRVPAGTRGPAQGPGIAPQAGRAWVESLPLSQSADAGRTILAQPLRDQPREDRPRRPRCNSLEIYRPVANVLLDELDAIYGHSLLPLPPKAREALAARARARDRVGLRLQDPASSRSPASSSRSARRSRCPASRLRAMERLVALLRTSYRSYTPIAEGRVARDPPALPARRERRVRQEPADAEKQGAASSTCTPKRCSSRSRTRTACSRATWTRSRRRDPRLPAAACTLGQARPSTSPSGATSSCHATPTSRPSRCCRPTTIRAGPTGACSTRTRSSTGCASAPGRGPRATSRPRRARPSAPRWWSSWRSSSTLWGDPPKRTSRRDPMDTSVAICAGLRAITHFVSSVDVYAEAGEGGGEDREGHHHPAHLRARRRGLAAA